MPCGTQDPAQLPASSPTGLSPCLVALPRAFGSSRAPLRQSYNPVRRSVRFRLFHFRSPLLAESFLFLGLLRCFSSPGSLASRRSMSCPILGFPIRISLAVCVCTRLASAFRSVPRPSSALDAKASPVCPSLLCRLSYGEVDPRACWLHVAMQPVKITRFLLDVCGC